ncbi:L-histidine N(alpha)-methyltransferase [Paenibacillus sp. PvR098]|uniref:L-histidine N(alpha)-methyltransferase n=1 Tax=unclassified Paenibacillus TaxID=185978 RepID=UPI001B629831|nr:dimethylhistidine N-methyltransferase [Paenibacillus sp. PvP091]MBP1169730.1 dimethylhistidine N-methyltransferase [Paenibacillus sp. PvR098]MBP2440758.1 dimethylhistidine N-methyltransferase [Paenibacillus sp. PvP052]
MEVIDYAPTADDFLSEVLFGFQKKQKELKPKFFYDEAGSLLFEQITGLSEYYVTRTELSILENYVFEMANMIGRDAALIEFGSGSSTKIKCLLNRLVDLSYYIPIDISHEILVQSADALLDDYTSLNVLPICADFTKTIVFPPLSNMGKKVIFYPGSTIGNFEPHEAKAFLSQACSLLKKGDGLLIGVDLQKDPHILHQAYNDKQGVTAKFNLNVLNRINRELRANFQLDQFAHRAFYNDKLGRIEMHIESLEHQKVSIYEYEFHFAEGETIHTENSYKYTIEGFQSMAEDCGFTPEKVWTDPNEWFSVHFLQIQ